MKQKSLADIRPVILGLSPSQTVFSIAELGDSIQISCEPWLYIRSTQIATLYINDQIAGAGHPPSVHDRLARPHSFNVPVHTYFRRGQTYRIYIVVTEPDGTDNPNKSYSKNLEISIDE